VLGATGMLGSVAFHVLRRQGDLCVFGSVRSPSSLRFFDIAARPRIIPSVDVENFDAIVNCFGEVKPDVVINCIGVIKQLSAAQDPLTTLPLNSLLPHRLERLCRLIGARFIHVSTDCVFSGRRGNYHETDVPDAEDLYGRSKLLGEVDTGAITLRTSIIGRELATKNGLVEWFLGSSNQVYGYTKAIFSGVTSDELARVIARRVLPRPNLSGVFHVSSKPISKYELLGVIKHAYDLQTEIVPDDSVAIDRSLNSERFREATGYRPPSWLAMIQKMHDLQIQPEQPHVR
jgi:dTDP-4-dehydrorhamnose reductase